MAEVSIKVILDGLRDAQRNFEAFSKSIEGFGRSMQSVGKKLSLYVTAPIIALGTVAVKFAADNERAARQFDRSFGDMADTVRDFSAQMSDALKLNQSSVEEMMTRINQMAVSLTGSRTAAAEMSKGIVLMAHDLAAFNGMQPEEAVNAMRLALIGNERALRSLGIVLTDQMATQALVNAGYAEEGEKLTDTQMAMGRYLAMLQATAQFQGVWQQDMTTWEGLWRTLRTTVLGFAETLGAELLPAARAALQWIVDFLPKVTLAIRQLKGMNEETKITALHFAVMAVALGPVLNGVGLLTALAGNVGVAFSSLGKFFVRNPVFLAAAAGAALLAAAIVTVVGLADDLRRTYTSALDWLKEKFRSVFGAIVTVFSWVKTALDSLGDYIDRLLAKLYGDDWQKIKDVADETFDGVLDAFSFMRKNFDEGWATITEHAKQMFGDVGDFVMGKLAEVPGVNALVGDKLVTDTADTTKKLRDLYAQLGAGIGEELKGVMDTHNTVLGAMYQGQKNFAEGGRTIFEGIRDVWAGALVSMRDTLVDWAMEGELTFSKFLNNIKRMILEFIAQKLVTKVGDWMLNGIIGAASSYFGSAAEGSAMAAVGKWLGVVGAGGAATGAGGWITGGAAGAAQTGIIAASGPGAAGAVGVAEVAGEGGSLSLAGGAAGDTLGGGAASGGFAATAAGAAIFGTALLGIGGAFDKHGQAEWRSLPDDYWRNTGDRAQLTKQGWIPINHGNQLYRTGGPGFGSGQYDMRAFATGGEGIFTRPSLISVAEQGPEEVSVGRLGARGARGGSTHIHFHGPVVADDISAEKFAKLIASKIGSRRMRGVSA